MAAATGILLLLIIPVVTSQSSSNLLQNVLGALEKMVHYYKENYMDLNIDGLFGLRVLEGRRSPPPNFPADKLRECVD